MSESMFLAVESIQRYSYRLKRQNIRDHLPTENDVYLL